MDYRYVVDEFRTYAAGFVQLGQGWQGSSTVYQIPDLPVVLKTYAPHENKEEPAVRAKAEYQMLMRVADLPGTPNTVQLVIVEGAPYLIREAGHLPDELTPAVMFQVQDTIEALFQRGILLNDYAQVAVRDDGSAFIYDLDNAGVYETADSRPLMDDRAQRANDSFKLWLREEGYPERDLRSHMEHALTRLLDLQETMPLLTLGNRISRYRALMALEDAVKAQMEAGLPVSAAHLWRGEDWQAQAKRAEQTVIMCDRRLENMLALSLPAVQMAAFRRGLLTRLATLEHHLLRADTWAVLLQAEEDPSSHPHAGQTANAPGAIHEHER